MTVRTVAVVDDHEPVTIALKLLIDAQDDLEFAGSATTVQGLLDLELKADLVVLDLRLSDGSAVRQNVLRLRLAGAKVLALTSGESPYLLRSAAKSDVLGIVRKSAAVDDIVDALVGASAGEFVSTSDWAAAVDGDPELRSARLSERERQVLELYAVGLSSIDVAIELDISPHTVDAHLKNIRARYSQLSRGSSSRLDLYRRAVEDGFLPLPEHLR